MSKELNQELAELVSAAKTAGQDAFVFIKEQAPDFAQQIIAWEFARGWLMVVGATGALLAAVITWLVCHRLAKRNNDNDYYGVAFVISTVALIFALAGGCSGISRLVKAHTAPKIVVMEKIAEAIRGR